MKTTKPIIPKQTVAQQLHSALIDLLFFHDAKDKTPEVRRARAILRKTYKAVWGVELIN